MRRSKRSATLGRIDTADMIDELDTASLMASGGDGRQVLDAETGLNRYGCSFVPDPDLIAFGSCTASSVGERGYRAAERLHDDLAVRPREERTSAIRHEFRRLRHRIAHIMAPASADHVDVMITPSGTDAELIPLALFCAADDAPVVSVVMGPTEVGSGTTYAAAGRAFDDVTPNGWRTAVGDDVDGELASRTTVREVTLRHADGVVRSDSDIDAEVVDIVTSAVHDGFRVLLHVVAHSKTGVHAPTLATVNRLEAAHAGRVGIVVDAAQGRVSRRGLHASLAQGHMVIITGSKFFGGPPFSGAVLVPRAMSPVHRGLARLPSGFGRYFSSALVPNAWPGRGDELPDGANVGLLLRWEAALAEMEAYYSVSPQRRLRVLRAFESMVPTTLGSASSVELEEVAPPLIEDGVARLLESKMTVFPFALLDRNSGSKRLGREALTTVHRRMFEDRRDSTLAVSEHERALLGQRIHLGQPVSVGLDRTGPAVLRLAIGAPKIVDLAESFGSGGSDDDWIARLEAEISTTAAALDLLSRHLPDRLQGRV